MTKRALYILAAVVVVAVAGLTAFTIPATAELQTIYVKLPSGKVVPVTVDVPPGTPLKDIPLPGVPVGTATTPTKPSTTDTTPSTTGTTTAPAPKPPGAGGGHPQKKSGTHRQAHKPAPKHRSQPKKKAKRRSHRKRSSHRKRTSHRKHRAGPHKPAPPKTLREPNGAPSPGNPTLMDTLPGPSTATSVPNFVIDKFRVPPFLLPIYQAAGIQYGVRWEVLAAINEIETDYGRNLSVSSAGAVGWMQFLPSTWRTWGIDGNHDGRKDPYNPVDAIFAAARYLRAAGYSQDVRRAIFAYNHADWYVDSVLLRARLIAGVPADLIGSLTGLTEGHFPVYARARYADDLAEQRATARVGAGQNAARLDSSSAGRQGIDIFARSGAPVIAVNDGVIKAIGNSARLGRYVVLQDVYGNRYTYAHLGSVARLYPVPKQPALSPNAAARALTAHGSDDRRPTAPASAGRQPAAAEAESRRPARSSRPAPKPRRAPVPVKQRLFAHPDQPFARAHGGLEQMLDQRVAARGVSTYRAYSWRPLGLGARDVRLRPLRKGSHVIGGTILGRIGKTAPVRAPHLYFEIRPAGRGAPRIDPKPILDGWKLLEATAIYRASGKNVLYGQSGFSIGQVLLLPKALLERRVLSDPRIDIYPCGRRDIATGQIDRRVLATLEYLAASGLDPTVTSLKCGHSFLTTSGNVSEHSSGNAVDIAKINGIPIAGHQDRGGIAEITVRRLLLLQGTMRPHQVISLLNLGGPSFALSDHWNHIHVGFRPLFGENRRLGRVAFAVLRPGQWSDLIARLRQIQNPVVPTRPSRFAIPAPRRGD
jgi:Transglycosylase SLT domain/Peptidase family M23